MINVPTTKMIRQWLRNLNDSPDATAEYLYTQFLRFVELRDTLKLLEKEQADLDKEYQDRSDVIRGKVKKARFKLCNHEDTVTEKRPDAPHLTRNRCIICGDIQ